MNDRTTEPKSIYMLTTPLTKMGDKKRKGDITSFFHRSDLQGVIVLDYDAVNSILEGLGASFRLGPAFGRCGMPTHDGISVSGYRSALYTRKAGPEDYRLDKALETYLIVVEQYESEPHILEHLPSIEILEAAFGAKLGPSVRSLYESALNGQNHGKIERTKKEEP